MTDIDDGPRHTYKPSHPGLFAVEFAPGDCNSSLRAAQVSLNQISTTTHFITYIFSFLESEKLLLAWRGSPKVPRRTLPCNAALAPRTTST